METSTLEEGFQLDLQLKRKIAVENLIENWTKFASPRLDRYKCEKVESLNLSSIKKSTNIKDMNDRWKRNTLAEIDDIIALNMETTDPTILYNIYNDVPYSKNYLKRLNKIAKSFGQFKPLSYFSKEYYFYNPSEDYIEYKVDDACIDNIQEFRKDINKIMMGKFRQHYCPYLKTIKTLSMATSLSGNLYDNYIIRNILKDLGFYWLRNSEIFLYYKHIKKSFEIYDSVIRVSKTEGTQKKCKAWFKNQLNDYLAEICQIYNFEDYFYLLSKELPDLIVDEIFSKVDRRLEKIRDEACDYVYKIFAIRKRNYEKAMKLDTDDEIIKQQIEEPAIEDKVTHEFNEPKRSKLDFQNLDILFHSELNAILSIHEYGTDYDNKMDEDEAVIAANTVNFTYDAKQAPKISLNLEFDNQVPAKILPHKYKENVNDKTSLKITKKRQSEEAIKNILPLKFPSYKRERKSINNSLSSKPLTIDKFKKEIKNNKNRAKLKSQIKKINYSILQKKYPNEIGTTNSLDYSKLYLDSYLSSGKDVYNLNNSHIFFKLNFNDDIGLLSPFHEYDNPIMHYLVANDLNMQQMLHKILPNIADFSISSLTLKNVFLWALAFSFKENNNASKSTNDENNDKLAEIERKKSLNPLLSAFRKKIEENKKIIHSTKNIAKSIFQILSDENISLTKPIVLNSSCSKLTDKSIKNEFYSFNNSLSKFLNDENLIEISACNEDLKFKDIMLVYHLQDVSKIVKGFYASTEKIIEENKLLALNARYIMSGEEDDFYIELDDSDNISLSVNFEEQNLKSLTTKESNFISSDLKVNGNVKILPFNNLHVSSTSSPNDISSKVKSSTTSVSLSLEPIPAPAKINFSNPCSIFLGSALAPQIQMSITTHDNIQSNLSLNVCKFSTSSNNSRDPICTYVSTIIPVTLKNVDIMSSIVVCPNVLSSINSTNYVISKLPEIKTISTNTLKLPVSLSNDLNSFSFKSITAVEDIISPNVEDSVVFSKSSFTSTPTTSRTLNIITPMEQTWSSSSQENLMIPDTKNYRIFEPKNYIVGSNNNLPELNKLSTTLQISKKDSSINKTIDKKLEINEGLIKFTENNFKNCSSFPSKTKTWTTFPAEYTVSNKSVLASKLGINISRNLPTSIITSNKAVTRNITFGPYSQNISNLIITVPLSTTASTNMPTIHINKTTNCDLLTSTLTFSGNSLTNVSYNSDENTNSKLNSVYSTLVPIESFNLNNKLITSDFTKKSINNTEQFTVSKVAENNIFRSTQKPKSTLLISSFLPQNQTINKPSSKSNTESVISIEPIPSLLNDSLNETTISNSYPPHIGDLNNHYTLSPSIQAKSLNNSIILCNQDTGQRVISSVKDSINLIKTQLKSNDSKNIRIYFFNMDNIIAKTAQDFLLSLGFKKFDPTNFNPLRHIINFECLVFVQIKDIKRIHHIPNLLRLKRDLRVNFYSYKNISDLANKRQSLIFPRAGIVVIDITALLALKSELLDGLCQFMKRQSVEKGTTWKLLVNKNTFQAIEQLTAEHESDLEEYVRLSEISQILANYQSLGILELLPSSLYDGCPLSSHDYHTSCIKLQIERLKYCRHFLYVSDMPRNHPDARLFLNNGIDIMNIIEFMRCFVSRSVTHVAKQHLPFVTRLSTRKFIDAGLSDACQSINI